jgi:methionyl-tRNA synthetase
VLPADVYFKYLKMKKEDAIFICGSDQHGTPIELRAIKEGTTPEKLSEDMHAKIMQLFENFECTFTYYGKTHTEQNKEVAYEIFNALKNNGYIVEVEDKQAYCNIDKRFLTDRLIEGDCPYCKYNKARGDQCENCGRLLDPDQLINPRCSICNKNDISFLKVKNLAIALDKLQDKILEFVEAGSKNNWSKNAKNKALSYIKEGLKPRDITRSMKWGIPVPVKGFEHSVFYVWYDAPIAYISMTKDWDREKWKNYWMSKDTRVVQFMGKDNIEFHTVMWPAFLLGSNLGYALPTTIRASEYLTSKEVKFSKSAGVGLNMQEAIKILDADYWRFSLMYMYPETADTEFSIEVLTEVVNKIMNDKIGNFIHRVLTIAKNNKELINSMEKVELGNEKEAINKILDDYKSNFENMHMREALYALISLAEFGNAKMSNDQPWNQLKWKEKEEGEKRFISTMSSLLKIAYNLSVLLWPFTPASSMKALSYFGIENEPLLDDLNNNPKPDLDKEITPLFSKLTDEKLEKIERFR